MAKDFREGRGTAWGGGRVCGNWTRNLEMSLLTQEKLQQFLLMAYSPAKGDQFNNTWGGVFSRESSLTSPHLVENLQKHRAKSLGFLPWALTCV